MKKRIFVLLLLLVFAFSLAPAASAEGSEVPQKWDVVYFGSFEGAPIRWLILDPEATNVGEPGLFLLSEYALKNAGVVYDWAKGVWQGSEGQIWCSGMLDSSFSAQERAAIPAVSKTEEVFQQFGLTWGEVSLEEEQLFFLSAKEAADYIGPNDGDEGLSAFMPNGSGTYYWLRTPHGTHGDYAGLVLEDNQVHDFLVYGSWGVRPATNLDAAALLLLSPAHEIAGVGAPAAIPRPEDGMWKATVVDDSIGFRVEEINRSGGNLTIRYTGAPADSFLSVAVRDAEGKLLSYGRLSNTEIGTATLTVSTDSWDLPEEGTLLFFAEMENGPENTNYASAPYELELLKEPEPTPTPEPEENEGGSISLVVEETPEPTAAPVSSGRSDEAFRAFLRQNGMFAIPFAILTLVAIVVAIVQKIRRRREEEEYEYYDDSDE